MPAGLAGADAVAEGVSDYSEGVGVGQAHDGCQCSPRRAPPAAPSTRLGSSAAAPRLAHASAAAAVSAVKIASGVIGV